MWMWEFIDATIKPFRKCFSRKAAFYWFVVVVVGLMIRSDQLGFTCIIRTLDINPRLYETMMHFFHASSWCYMTIQQTWTSIVASSDYVMMEANMPILVGDGIKRSKEGKRMAAVKKHHQESENSAKPTYIYGHLFGAIGMLLTNGQKIFCTPISMTIQDGAKVIGQWMENDLADDSHVVRLVRESCRRWRLQ